MAAAINFYANNGDVYINNIGGSGLGFYGTSFGSSVQVGQYQDTTYVTNATGTVNAWLANNVKFISSLSGSVNGGATQNVKTIPNKDSTLNIRFTNDTAVITQNAEVRIYDRVDINNAASGVVTKIATIVHPGTSSAGPSGSGSAGWYTLDYTTAGSGVSLWASPGASGLSPNGSLTSDTRHDWFLAISASPSSIGSKTAFGLYCSLEYL